MASDREQQPEATPFRQRHTLGQRLVLVVNVVVIVMCFAGGTALLIGKREREAFLAIPNNSIVTTTSPPTTAHTAGGSVPQQSTTVDAGPVETFPAVDPQAVSFLVTGNDSNACIDPDSPWASAADPERPGGSRSDTIMVMRLDPVTKAAAVLSFPRDLWVDIQGRGKGRINSTTEKGDVTLLRQTLYDNFGIEVQHSVQIDFCAFKTIVEAVGGVSVPFQTPIRDRHINLNITVAGCHEFGGDEALAYVRSRYLEYQTPDGQWKQDGLSDLSRISRQQDFLRRTLKAALDKGLFNPSVARGVLVSLQKYIAFEAGFTIDDLLKFAGLLRDIDPNSIRTYQIQTSRYIVSGQDVLLPKVNGENMKAILAIFRGEAQLVGAPDQRLDTTTTSAPATTATVPPPTTTGSSTTGTATTSPSPTVAPTVTDPPDISKGIVPLKDAQCP